MLKLVEYDESFLALSWIWLNDPETAKLTMTPAFTKEQQISFFSSLRTRNNYFIRGIVFKNEKIGAAGIKNISECKGEYWGYIGVKTYWGKGLGKQIMQCILSEAVKLGLKKIYLYVNINNERALKLYQREGFVALTVENDLVLMERCL